MYGLADAGVQSSSFGNGRKLTLNSGIAEGSRIGFRGAEDLGGGYRAVFTLEARVEIDNGTQATALLSSASNQNLTHDLSQAGAPNAARWMSRAGQLWRSRGAFLSALVSKARRRPGGDIRHRCQASPSDKHA
ncbi:hypothetical protein CD932_23285 [Janthinobacterium sp. PC23-8]|nr:hypothetical protein CD932_23285 [Janthinobacterium sp. PC23-8]